MAIKPEKQNKVIITFVIFILIIFVLQLIRTVGKIEGNATIVNYTGIIRGGSQRLIKNELAGYQNEQLLKDIDYIINELQFGDETLRFKTLEDPIYLENLSEMALQWNEMISLLYKYRSNKNYKHQLYKQSEKFFEIADSVVYRAASYTEGVVKDIQMLEYIVVGVLLALLVTIITMLMHNDNSASRLIKMAYTDSKINIPNKRACDYELSKQASFERLKSISVFVFDLNNLKNINDSKGHAIGDTIIYDFAQILKTTALPNMFVGRYGGDEFLGIMYDANEQKIDFFKTAIMKEIKNYNSINQFRGYEISVSMGYAFSDNSPESTIYELFDMADKEMYGDKLRQKKNN